jgi:hypothetical protein
MKSVASRDFGTPATSPQAWVRMDGLRGGKDLLVAFYNPLPPASAREARMDDPTRYENVTGNKARLSGPRSQTSCPEALRQPVSTLLARLLRLNTSLQLNESAGQGIANQLTS